MAIKKSPLEKLQEKRAKLLEEYKSLNRHDFSGSWADRIRNNTGPQFGPMEVYERNVARQMKVMNTYNSKTRKKLDELEGQIKALQVAA